MVAQSAISRREQTSRVITRCAQDLAIEHGFDGFTLDDLAERAGVSRRTLFNYFPGKEAAVLGVPAALDTDVLRTFVAGGTTDANGGRLLEDLAALVVSTYTREDPDRADWHRVHALFERNPRLIAVAKERFDALVSDVRVAAEEREGLPAGHPRARVAVAIIAGIFHDSLARFLADEDIDFPTDFLAGVDEATRLLR
ncbi:TetR family transcriptional regulator [Knoellia locipacati]|uniref:TetR family transcriptional regulator n=1 Tax=Knoellia locipacati TaxID=882824 RepID=A0A512T1P2_9MICO|nr:TetR family transcriptional regulator [Knoellia locipacati]GEQ14126.1 TetR family transcriptional regulator [Knoellia locipacati]